VARLSLADIANSAATLVHYDFTEFSGCSGLMKDHFVQGAPGRMVVGCLDNASTIFVYTWRDGVANPDRPPSVAISSVPKDKNYTSTDPDGLDWLGLCCASLNGMISGSTYRSSSRQPDEYLFAFQAGRNPGGGRPQAYVRLESLTSVGESYRRIAGYDIWNANYAFAMAALGSDGQEIGINLAVGGGTVGYPQMAVGYKDDFVVYQVTQSNTTEQRNDGIVRFGDYLSARLVPAINSRFGAAVYEVILDPLPPGMTSGTCATLGTIANLGLGFLRGSAKPEKLRAKVG
jgi:hypothetical protein